LLPPISNLDFTPRPPWAHISMEGISATMDHKTLWAAVSQRFCFYGCEFSKDE
jgi:hypothetical protein